MKCNTEQIVNAYEKIRNGNDVTWAAFGYDANGDINVLAEGADFEEFRKMCTESERLYCFACFTTGDEMSKRKKFSFITWIGEQVQPMKKAQVGSHKAELRRIIQNVAVEVQACSRDEISVSVLRNLIVKAGGASYGTGSN